MNADDIKNLAAPHWEGQMFNSIDTGTGWYSLLADCIGELSVAAPGFKILQIKEKFGGLRFYFSVAKQEHYDRANKIVRKAEQLSYVTCEHCGSAGKSQDGGWIKVLCDPCQSVRMKARGL